MNINNKLWQKLKWNLLCISIFIKGVKEYKVEAYKNVDSMISLRIL